MLPSVHYCAPSVRPSSFASASPKEGKEDTTKKTIGVASSAFGRIAEIFRVIRNGIIFVGGYLFQKADPEKSAKSGLEVVANAIGSERLAKAAGTAEGMIEAAHNLLSSEPRETKDHSDMSEAYRQGVERGNAIVEDAALVVKKTVEDTASIGMQAGLGAVAASVVMGASIPVALSAGALATAAVVTGVALQRFHSLGDHPVVSGALKTPEMQYAVSETRRAFNAVITGNPSEKEAAPTPATTGQTIGLYRKVLRGEGTEEEKIQHQADLIGGLAGSYLSSAATYVADNSHAVRDAVFKGLHVGATVAAVGLASTASLTAALPIAAIATGATIVGIAVNAFSQSDGAPTTSSAVIDQLKAPDKDASQNLKRLSEVTGSVVSGTKAVAAKTMSLKNVKRLAGFAGSTIKGAALQVVAGAVSIVHSPRE